MMMTTNWSQGPLLLILLLSLSACTLDFEEFSAYTPGSTKKDAGGAQDLGVDLLPLDARVEQGADIAPDLPPALDSDGDGHPDTLDNCPEISNPDQMDTDEDGVGDLCDLQDTDGDGYLDEQDNCPSIANPDQGDLDGDLLGDLCDPDADGDGLDLAAEEALGTHPLRADTDGDGVLDGEDSCPLQTDPTGQDTDMDGMGDVCDLDDDADGIPDWQDNCPATANPNQALACAGDLDGDGAPDASDTCPHHPNPDQNIRPCESRFETLTYSRNVWDLSLDGALILAATEGGLLEYSPDGTQRHWSNAEGLSGNHLRALFLDAQGRRWLVHEAGISVVRPDGFLFNFRPGPGILRDVVVNSQQQVWVSSDQGLYLLVGTDWSHFGVAEMLPSDDVRGLHIDPRDRLWLATAGGLARIDSGPILPVALPPELGAPLALEDAINGGIWLMAEQGLLLLDAEGRPDPLQRYEGFGVHSLIEDGEGLYLGSPEGLRRVDEEGRLYPPSQGLLPGEELRALAAGADGTRWVATDGGLVGLDGYFATFQPGNGLPQPCVRSSTRVGDTLWIATSMGLFLQREGEFQAVNSAQLPGADIRVIRQVGEEIWLGTNGGIARLDLTGIVRGQFIPADGIPNAPVTDILPIEGRVWIATSGGGLARREGEGAWQIFHTGAEHPNLLTDHLHALAHDGQALWVASYEGLMIYDEAEAAFRFPVRLESGQRLPDNRVNDLIIYEGRIFAATDRGIAVGTQDDEWETLNRTAGSFPSSVGSDLVRALAHDGSALWALLESNQRQEFGALLRLEERVEGGWEAQLFNAENADLLESPGEESVNLEWGGEELFISYCDPALGGGVSISDGSKMIVADHSGEGLPGNGSLAALTLSLAGRPLFSTQQGEQRLALEIQADQEKVNFELPAEVEALLTRCAPSESDLWCIFNGYGIARYTEAAGGIGAWWPMSAAILSDSELRALVLWRSGPGGDLEVWIASSLGVTLFRGGNLSRINRAQSSGGLPHDDTRALAIQGRTLYAGTAGGVGIYSIDERSWSTLGADQLPNVDIKALAVAPDGTLWIGSAEGLFRHRDGEELQRFGIGQGLPSESIQVLALHPDGRLIVGTDQGLALGSPEGSFSSYGYAEGLPGRQVLSIIITQDDGQIWIQSDDGIALLR